MATSTRRAAAPATSASPKPAAPARPAARPKPVKTAAAPARKAPAQPANGQATSQPDSTPERTEKKPVKMIRDGFNMPEPDFALIAQLKSRALSALRPAKKSELLRAGLHLLAALPAERLVSALEALTPVKSGRPKKASK